MMEALSVLSFVSEVRTDLRLSSLLFWFKSDEEQRRGVGVEQLASTGAAAAVGKKERKERGVEEDNGERSRQIVDERAEKSGEDTEKSLDVLFRRLNLSLYLPKERGSGELHAVLLQLLRNSDDVLRAEALRVLLLHFSQRIVRSFLSFSPFLFLTF